MKLLYVTGSDYSAMHISDEFGIEKAIKLAEENGGSYIVDNDEIYAELKILEFGEVDSNFISFIEDKFIDYDVSKGTDFFIIKD